MTENFLAKEHIFEGQHIREYPGALASSQEDVLKLHANQYIPRAGPRDESAISITVVAFHANAFTKETYEPFFDDLFASARKSRNIHLNSIWIADQAYQGESAMLNEKTMGNDPHWFDHSRDVLAMINVFRSQMRRPIVGIAHSMGADQAVALAHFHPRLFTSLVLIEPPMTYSRYNNVHLMLNAILSKPGSFDSREAAENCITKSPFLRGWDPRALKRYLDTAFRESSDKEKMMTWKTGPHIEALHAIRPNPDNAHPDRLSPDEQYVYPDLDPRRPQLIPAYNPATGQAYKLLPMLRPPTYFVLGKGSPFVSPEGQDERERITGSGGGGSGGIRRGKVGTITLTGGHCLPFTNPRGTAAAIFDWLAPQLDDWARIEAAWKEQWDRKTLSEKQSLSTEAMKIYQKWDGQPWNKIASKL